MDQFRIFTLSSSGKPCRSSTNIGWFFHEQNSSTRTAMLKKQPSFRRTRWPAKIAAVGLGFMAATRCALADPQTIRPGEIWPDDRGQHVQAHGGGILKFDDTYFWFGEDRSQGFEPGQTLRYLLLIDQFGQLDFSKPGRQSFRPREPWPRVGVGTAQGFLQCTNQEVRHVRPH